MSWEYLLGQVVAVLGAGSLGAFAMKYLDHVLAKRKQDADIAQNASKMCSDEDNIVISKLSDRIDTVERQLAASMANEIECLKQHAATQAEHAKTQRELGRLEGKVQAFEAELSSLRSIVSMLQRPQPSTVINQGTIPHADERTGDSGIGIGKIIVEGEQK